MGRHLLLVTLALAPLGLLGCPPAQGGGAGAPSPAAARVAVGARGRLTPAGRIRSVACPPAERVVRLEVDEQAEVAEGQVLAILEGHDEQQAAVSLARASLAAAERLSVAIERQYEELVRHAEQTIAQLEATTPPRLAALEAENRRREAAVAQHRAELERLLPLLKRGIANQNDVDRQQHILEQAVSSREGGVAELAEARARSSGDLAIARTALAQRRTELERERATLRLEALRAELALAEARLARTVVRAPCAGQVLRLLTRPGEVTGSSALLTLADTRAMLAVVEVYESDRRLLRLGQRARLTSPALPGQLAGAVQRVGRVVARNRVYDLDPAADADVRVFEVEVALDDPRAAADYVSLQVDAVIELGAGTAAPGSAATDEAPR